MARKKIAPFLADFLDDPEYPNHGIDAEGGPTRIEAAVRDFKKLLKVVEAARKYANLGYPNNESFNKWYALREALFNLKEP